MRARSIVNYTEIVAGRIAAEFSGAPLDELRVWLRVAHQREAMVSELYDLSKIERRFSELPGQGPASVIRSVVASIWAHEESHTRYLATLRSISEPLPWLAAFQGRLEGLVTGSATEGGVVARLLIALGASLGRAPDFATELGRMTLLELLRFHGELETTARMGYERILQLVRALSGDADVARDFGYTLPYDIARILCEESFHEAVFFEMSDWVDTEGSGETLRALSVRQCVEALHAHCEANLSVGAVRRLALAHHPELEAYWPDLAHVRQPKPHQDRWVSDGGLGQVFTDQGLPVPVGAALG